MPYLTVALSRMRFRLLFCQTKNAFPPVILPNQECVSACYFAKPSIAPARLCIVPTLHTSSADARHFQALDKYIFASQAFIFLVSVEITIVGNVAIFNHEKHCGAVSVNRADALAHLFTRWQEEASIFDKVKPENFTHPHAFQGCAHLDDTWLLGLMAL